jgi:glyoxylase-like metal-dependent hydrolase (beta-lactamase superfamily II)
LEAFLRWTIGAVRITKIAEFDYWPISGMIQGATQEVIRRHADSIPRGFANSLGLVVAIQSFVVESAGLRILIDTCIGNNKTRSNPRLNNLITQFLDRLAQAGFPAESIDFVVCTHIHSDHVGWNTIRRNSTWLPTFPNARYLLGAYELHTSQVLPSADLERVLADSIQPLFTLGLGELIDLPYGVTDEVTLVGYPGHTPGHLSVWIESSHQAGVISGDVIHSPLQVALPTLGAVNDFDASQAYESRQQLIGRCVESNALLIGTHFPDPTAGHVRQQGTRNVFLPWPGHV